MQARVAGWSPGRVAWRVGGAWKGFAIHQQQGTALKQERLDSTCPDLSSPTHPHTRTHAATVLHPTLSPCPPARLPKDLPVGWPRTSFSIHSITIPTPSRSRLNPIPSQGPQAADLTSIALHPAADTQRLLAVEGCAGHCQPPSRLALRPCPTSARPMAS